LPSAETWGDIGNSWPPTSTLRPMAKGQRRGPSSGPIAH